MKLNFLALFLLLITIVGCKQKEQETPKNWKQINENLIVINKYLLQEDEERVESYIERKQWNMERTNTGLWYQITQEGKGENAKESDIVTINYTVESLDGTLIYSSDSAGEKVFKVGFGNVESGLQEGIKLMNEGSKARFIMLPHLAWGLVGDDNKINSRSIIVYYVELLSID